MPEIPYPLFKNHTELTFSRYMYILEAKLYLRLLGPQSIRVHERLTVICPVQCPHHCNESADEPEVHEVVGIDARGCVNLQTVVTGTGIFKQAVHGIEDIVRQVEKPLPEAQT